MPKVINNFRDIETKKLYRKGDSYKGTQKRVASLVEKGFLEAEAEPEQEVKHVGGGYYKLPNGEKVKGKKKALEALEGE